MSYSYDVEQYEIPNEWALKYAKLGLIDLLTIAEKGNKQIIAEEGTKEAYAEFEFLNERDPEPYYAFLVFLNRLELIKTDTIKDKIQGEIEVYEDRIKGLEKTLWELEKKFNNHRHDVSKIYSEKVVW